MGERQNGANERGLRKERERVREREKRTQEELRHSERATEGCSQ